MKAIGLISGTSLDGIDAVIVDIPDEWDDNKSEVQQIGFATYPYPDGLRERLLEVSTPGHGTVDQICHLNAYVGELFARAVLRIAEDTNVALNEIDVIGSHGQTIHHLPMPQKEPEGFVTSTLQIGEPSIIAERTGVATVADFRPRDMAAGGQGAPFAPYAHYALFRHPEKGRIITNIGGIGNITYIPAGASPEQVMAFDTGPGNMVIDALVARFTGGVKTYDRNGEWAANGHCHEELLAWMLTHPYLQRVPPKSTGREEFGEVFVRQVEQHSQTWGISEADMLATTTTFTTETIAKSCQQFLPEDNESYREMLCCGGGVKNPYLMDLLKQACAPIPVRTVEQCGVSSDALEAITFALLARATLLGKPGNLPSVTGARRSVILGKIILGNEKIHD